METYTTIPSEFVIGDTVIIDIAPGAYPSPEYELELVFISATSKVVAVSTVSGDNHRFTVDTSSFSSGRHDYQLKVTGTGYRRTLQSGFTMALVDLAGDSIDTYDGRSHVKKVLDALEAAIEGRASKTQLRHEFDGVSIEHLTLEQQIDMRDKYKMKYHRELATAAGRSSWQTITPRFPV